MKHKLDQIISYKPVGYLTAINKMESLVSDIQSRITNSTIWMLEHPPIYTAGSSAKEKDLLEKKFPVYQSGRGGQYTYHGPGQRIIYCMINLKELQDDPDIRQFVNNLESVTVLTLKEIGLDAFLKEEKIGIWVNENGNDAKIAAIGIRVKKWITYHGIAINITPNLSHYNGIIPCGIKEFGVTSLEKLGFNISFSEFDQIFAKHFCNIFNFEIAKSYETA